MASNGIVARRSFNRIWIAGKKPLVKRAPAHIRCPAIIFFCLEVLTLGAT